MNKSELILSIINVFDENAELKQKLESERMLSQVKVAKDETATDLEKYLYVIGKKALYENVTYSYRKDNINFSRDDEGNLRVTTFENWLDNYLLKDKIPGHLSYQEVYEFLEADLKAEYEHEKNKKRERFLEKENE